MTTGYKPLKKVPGLYVAIAEQDDGKVQVTFTYDEKIIGVQTWTPPFGGFINTMPFNIDHMSSSAKTYLFDYLEAFDKKRRGGRFNPPLK